MNALRLRRLGLKAGRLVASKLGRSRKVYFRHRVDEYRGIWRRAAEECGAELEEVASDIWVARRDGVRVFIRSGEIQLDDPVTLIMAGRKPLMHRLLGEAGLPVPLHAVFGLDDLAPALDVLSQRPEGVVVKPANGTAAGDGVSTHLTTPAQVRRASVVASLYDSELLAEEMVPGESYRLLVVGGRLRHAVGRRGPRVLGDGRSTVRELIVADNALRTERGRARLDIDADCLYTLGWQGSGLDSVPAEGREVLVKAAEDRAAGDQELRTVYNTDVTGIVSEPVRDVAERAAAVLGSDLLGVDIITPDPTLSLDESGGCINEVNTTPALHHHYDARVDAYPTVSVEVLELALRRKAARAEG